MWQHLARAGAAVRKCSRRDLASVVARGGDGATTVAGTMVLAHAAGVEVFATGGIGGVHRGGADSLGAWQPGRCLPRWAPLPRGGWARGRIGTLLRGPYLPACLPVGLCTSVISPELCTPSDCVQLLSAQLCTRRAADVSADLTELGRTPMAVVCAGVKSILDIGLTLEYLETQGVAVATLSGAQRREGEGLEQEEQQRRTEVPFPAFFTPESGFPSPNCIGAQRFFCGFGWRPWANHGSAGLQN